MLQNKCFVISITIDNEVIYLQQNKCFSRKKKSQNDCNQGNVVFYYHTIG